MKKRYYGPQGDYVGEHARHKEEYEDSRMIREDHACVANMPQDVMMKPWPKREYAMDGGLDDTITGIDNQINEGERQMRRHMNPKKY